MIYFNILQYLLYRYFKKKAGIEADYCCITSNFTFIFCHVVTLGIFFNFSIFDYFEGKTYYIPTLAYFAFLANYYWDETALDKRMNAIEVRREELHGKFNAVYIYIFLSLILGVCAIIKRIFEEYG